MGPLTAALAAEMIRDKRRQERKKFKIDRAAAMLEAAKAAEKVLVTGEVPENAVVTDAQGKSVVLEEGAEVGKLTASTFLVRPSRPDTNRNRGKKQFKRRPAVQEAAAGAAAGATASAPASSPAPPPPPPPPVEDDDPSDDEAANLVEEHEHLQLSYEEAWFLSAAIGVLRVQDSNGILPNAMLLSALLTPTPSPTVLTPSSSPPPLYPSDPFLVSYAAYHHYRSLGWCVRHGTKFCVDWLLYRKGPVFSHSAFSILLVPVYMDDEDAKNSPFAGDEWHTERMSWKWVNTVTRVNNLVMKVGRPLCTNPDCYSHIRDYPGSRVVPRVHEARRRPRSQDRHAHPHEPLHRPRGVFGMSIGVHPHTRRASALHAAGINTCMQL